MSFNRLGAWGMAQGTRAPSRLCCSKPRSQEIQQDAQAAVGCLAGPLLASGVCLAQWAPRPLTPPGLTYGNLAPSRRRPLQAGGLSFCGATQGPSDAASCEAPSTSPLCSTNLLIPWWDQQLYRKHFYWGFGPPPHCFHSKPSTSTGSQAAWAQPSSQSTTPAASRQGLAMLPTVGRPDLV